MIIQDILLVNEKTRFFLFKTLGESKGRRVQAFQTCRQAQDCTHSLVASVVPFPSKSWLVGGSQWCILQIPGLESAGSSSKAKQMRIVRVYARPQTPYTPIMRRQQTWPSHQRMPISNTLSSSTSLSCSARLRSWATRPCPNPCSCSATFSPSRKQDPRRNR